MSTITTVNPATGEEIQTYDVMSEQAATDRLDACHAAFLDWRERTHQDRGAHLTRIGETLRDRTSALQQRQDMRPRQAVHRDREGP